MKKIIGVFLLGLLVFALSKAHPTREIPSVLTQEEVDALLAGRSVMAALPAETFGYPNPQRVSNWARELDLTVEQQGQIKNLLTITHNRTTYFGRKIVGEELLLDDYFRQGKKNYAELSNRLESIGNSRWRLRLAHLEAYLKTKMVLDSNQLKKYHELRAASPTGVSAE
jgi:Spy/CpxP family protein refolding chaperone